MIRAPRRRASILSRLACLLLRHAPGDLLYASRVTTIARCRRCRTAMFVEGDSLRPIRERDLEPTLSTLRALDEAGVWMREAVRRAVRERQEVGRG